MDPFATRRKTIPLRHSGPLRMCPGIGGAPTLNWLLSQLFVGRWRVRCQGGMLEKLVARSPTAEIQIGGVPVGCVLDTGPRHH